MEFSKIRDVCIEISSYNFNHSPSTIEKSNPNFVGRSKFFERFKLAISPLNNNRGAYLVTGYRGMGKTSAVMKALRELKYECKKSKTEIEIIELSLSQNDVDEIDLLRQVTKLLLEYWISANYHKKAAKKNVGLALSKYLVWASLLLLLGLLCFDNPEVVKWLKRLFFGKSWLWLLIPVFIGTLLNFVHYHRNKQHFINTQNAKNSFDSIKVRLLNLNNRLYAEVTKGKEISASASMNAGFKFYDYIKENAPSVLNLQYRQSTNDTINYNAASYKEIEKELLLILEKIKKERNKKHIEIPHFVFVIDELDKVAPDYPSSSVHSNTNLERDTSIRTSRTESITALLSRMKNFITSAEGKFIFIGGRDMYDASLADIADREAFFSSIFNHVFNLNSFFKDSINGKNGITEVSEGFICQHLNVNYNSNDQYKLSTYINNVKKKHSFTDKEIGKVAILLQNFIIFLTYRSNGSPKKIIELFEQYIIPEEKYQKIKRVYEPLTIESLNHTNAQKKKLYLRFSYIQQYEIGATASLYRPYLIIHSRHLKLLEDKLLYSSAFIIDHILKFHKTAFSWNNIEVIPDIILASSNPNLRPYLQEIMDFFSNIHIRQTVNAIHQYKFYSKTRNEIQYLSKISELSAAAFNFTLDESRHIKNYYQDILNQKRNVYNQTNIDIDNQYIHSIEYLNSILGDLEYYDENYDKSILKYTDAIQTLRNILTDGKKMSYHQSTLFVRKKLKLGLSLEKLKSFDSSYSIYRSLTLQAGNLATFKGLEVSKLGDAEWELPFRRMQLFVRPHISLLDIIEKQRVDGITFSNLKRNISDYCALLGLKNIFPSTEYNKLDYHEIIIQKKPPKKKSDNKRLQTLIYDYYSNVGSILFFKNKNFVRLHQLAFETLLSGELSTIKIPEGLSSKLNTDDSIVDPDFKSNKKQNIKLSNLYNFTKYQCYDNNKNQIDKNLLSQYSPSLSAYFYYRAALKNFILPYEENLKKIFEDLNTEQGENVTSSNDFLLTLRLTYPETSIILNSTQNFILGNLLTRIGDTALSIISKYSVGNLDLDIVDLFIKKISNKEILTKVEKYFKIKTSDKENTSKYNNYFFDINFPLYIYFLASIYYKKSSRGYSYAFQHKKIMYVIRDYVSQFIPPVKDSEIEKAILLEQFLKKIENIALKVIKNTNRISGASSIAEHLKYTDTFEGDKAFDPYILSSLSTSQEVREVLILAEQIKTRIYKQMPKDNHKSIQGILNKDDTISSIYVRIIEMNYQSEFNYHIFTSTLSHKLTIENGISPIQFLINIILYLISGLDQKSAFKKGQQSNSYENLKKLALDSIFCLQEAIKAIEVYGKGFIITHSYLGNLHLKLSTWCFVYNIFKQIDEGIEAELRLLFGEGDTIRINQRYHLELANMMFEDSIELHNQGKPYKAIKSNMYFLEDDYNDNLTHFCASIERYNLNTGIIGNKLNKIQTEISKQETRSYEDYFIGKSSPVASEFISKKGDIVINIHIIIGFLKHIYLGNNSIIDAQIIFTRLENTMLRTEYSFNDKNLIYSDLLDIVKLLIKR